MSVIQTMDNGEDSNTSFDNQISNNLTQYTPYVLVRKTTQEI